MLNISPLSLKKTERASELEVQCALQYDCCSPSLNSEMENTKTPLLTSAAPPGRWKHAAVTSPCIFPEAVINPQSNHRRPSGGLVARGFRH